MQDAAAAQNLLGGSHTRGRWFEWVCRLSTWSAMAILLLLLFVILWQGASYVTWQFISGYKDELRPEKSGILPALWGSFWLMLMTCLISIPIGIGAAVYLEEYSSDTWLTRVIKVNLSNLAGVPSIVYGILGLTVFARMFGIFEAEGIVTRMTGMELNGVQGPLGIFVPLPFGPTIMSGALTLSLLSLPVIIVATQEALRSIPQSLRHAAIALGATRWQTISRQVLPAALPGIITGVILAISRAIGETAPLIVVGCAASVFDSPANISSPTQFVTNPDRLLHVPFSDYTALPVTLYFWAADPKEVYQHLVPAGIIVLLLVLLAINGLAIYIRNRAQKNLNW